MFAAIDGNPDRPLYEYAYNNRFYAFDIGYSILSAIFRDILRQPFVVFWASALVMELLLLAVLYDKTAIILGYPTLLYVAASLFGTQVRYGIASVTLLISLLIAGSSRAKVAGIITSASMHASMLLPLAVSMIMSSKPNVKAFFARSLVAAAALLVFWLLMHIVVANTRFSYYLGDEFGEAKSMQSLLYAASFFLLLAYARTYPALRALPSLDVGIALLMIVFGTATFIVLSGRMLILFMLLEPIIISQAVNAGTGVGRVFGAACFGLGLLKFASLLMGSW